MEKDNKLTVGYSYFSPRKVESFKTVDFVWRRKEAEKKIFE